MLNDEYFAALGKIAVLAAHVENAIDLLVVKASDFTKAYIFIAHSTMPHKLDLLQTFVDISPKKTDELETETKQLCKATRDISAMRNTLIHNIVVKEEEGDRHYLIKLSVRGKFRARKQTVSLEYTQQLVDLYNEHLEILTEYEERYFPDWPST